MLINCVVYEDGSRLAEIPVARIADYASLPNCFVWVALRDPTPDELQEVRAVFHLHELAVEDALHGHQRPKVEEYADSLFVVMHMIERGRPASVGGSGSPSAEPVPVPLEIGEVGVFVGRNYVVSVRSRSQGGFREVRERCEREPELLRTGPGFVLYALMDAVVDRYFPIIDGLESELEAIEQRIFTQGAARDSIRRLYELKQRLTLLKHAVAPLLEGTGKLHGGRVPQVCIASQEYFRDVLDHLSRIDNSIDAMRDTIGTAIHVNLSMVTIEDGEVTKRLAAWASIFAVCTAFAGIWGMNFEHMPELKWAWGYPVALGLIAGICGYLFYRFRRAGWL